MKYPARVASRRSRILRGKVCLKETVRQISLGDEEMIVLKVFGLVHQRLGTKKDGTDFRSNTRKRRFNVRTSDQGRLRSQYRETVHMSKDSIHWTEVLFVRTTTNG